MPSAVRSGREPLASPPSCPLPVGRREHPADHRRLDRGSNVGFRGLDAAGIRLSTSGFTPDPVVVPVEPMRVRAGDPDVGVGDLPTVEIRRVRRDAHVRVGRVAVAAATTAASRLFLPLAGSPEPAICPSSFALHLEESVDVLHVRRERRYCAKPRATKVWLNSSSPSQT